MSTLTKAFVVLVTVLSILLVALVVSFVANTQDLSQRLRLAEQEREAARQVAVTRQAELSAAQEGAGRQITQLNNQINDLASQVTSLQAQLQTAQTSTQQERARLAGLEASLSQLSAAGAQTSALLEAVNQELQQRRGEAVTQQTKLIESADRIAELEGQLESLTRQVRRFSERMVSVQSRSQQLENVIAQLPENVRRQLPGVGQEGGATRAAASPEQPISGQVTQVQQAGGETLVQVNVGRNDAVQENMQFMVHRGDQFIGNLLVESVDSNAAIGRMTLSQGQVQAGDQIFAGAF